MQNLSVMQVQHGPSVVGQGTAKYETTMQIEIGYYLILNPMTGKAEEQQVFGPWPDKQALRGWYESQKNPTGVYHDHSSNLISDLLDAEPHSYRKVFKPGSVLEWCNPFEDEFEKMEPAKSLAEWGQPRIFGHGVYEQIVRAQELPNTTRLYRY